MSGSGGMRFSSTLDAFLIGGSKTEENASQGIIQASGETHAARKRHAADEDPEERVDSASEDEGVHRAQKRTKTAHDRVAPTRDRDADAVTPVNTSTRDNPRENLEGGV